MQHITPFTFENRTIRNVIDGKGEPWFVLADVCHALEIRNSRDVGRRLDDDERADVEIFDTSSDGADQHRRMTIINESGLYFVILRCQSATRPGSLPYRFRKWVTAEVLPAIRKTGRYEAPAPQAATGESYVQILAHEYITPLNKLTTAQDRAMTLRERNSEIMGLNQYKGVAEILINETTLSDEEIAARLESLLGRYMPEWVAWNRRLLSGVQPS